MKALHTCQGEMCSCATGCKCGNWHTTVVKSSVPKVLYAKRVSISFIHYCAATGISRHINSIFISPFLNQVLVRVVTKETDIFSRKQNCVFTRSSIKSCERYFFQHLHHTFTHATCTHTGVTDCETECVTTAVHHNQNHFYIILVM